MKTANTTVNTTPNTTPKTAIPATRRVLDFASLNSEERLQAIFERFMLIDGELCYRRTGKRCLGTPNNTGRRQCELSKGNKILVHRVVFTLGYGREPSKYVDHIDGNPDNNHLDNLREVSAWQNSQNRSNPAALFPKVCLHKASGKYQFSFLYHGKREYKCGFLTPADAFVESLVKMYEVLEGSDRNVFLWHLSDEQKDDAFIAANKYKDDRGVYSFIMNAIG